MFNLNFFFIISKVKITIFCFVTFVSIGFAQLPIDLVDPKIGTGRADARWFFFSSACRPFGMVNLSPDMWTKDDWGSGYLYDSLYIRCFSHIHAWELGGIAVMPTTGDFKGHKGMEAYKSKFSHSGEIAKPGYHKIYLDDYRIQVELTSTTRVGFHKYTFPKCENSYIIFDLGAHLGHGRTIYSEAWKVSETEIAGLGIMERTLRRPINTPVYFYAQINKPYKNIITWIDGKIVNHVWPNIGIELPERVSGINSGLAIKYATVKNEEILLKVAISYVSVEQAKLNLESELAHWNFEQIKIESFNEWNDMLNRIEIKGGLKEQQIKFYTDLWHALLGRRIVSDVNGKYLDMTGLYPRVRQVRLDSKGDPISPHHEFDAWWGSHWSLNILWSMVYPEIMDAFCNTMVDIYKNGGLIPRGYTGGYYTPVMIGDPASSFFATAYNKGIRNYETKLAYEGLKKNAFPGGIRDRAGYEYRKNASGGGMTYYLERGYVPDGRSDIQGGHRHACCAMTLEYAYQDWCLAQLAHSMGKMDDYDYFMRRSQNYKNLWNAESGYFQPRDMNGNWIDNFDPLNLKGFCESNAAIYLHFVPHDISGLIKLHGGPKQYIKKLNNQFQLSEPVGFYLDFKEKGRANWTDYGNQPGTGMAHLFNHAGAPWLSQYWVRRVKSEYGGITPQSGYRGDEDQGQMGALGVLMAIGLFEVDGGASIKPNYEITSPIFDKITIHLNNNYYPGKTFIIETENNNNDNIYILKALLNGKDWNSFRFPHEEFIKGGHLKIILGDKPNKKWGTE